jgi:hypothetical protein
LPYRPPGRWIRALAFTTGLAALSLSAAAQPTATGCPIERQAALQQQADQQLARYGEQFQGIQFNRLQGGSDWLASLSGLELLLGYQPVVLDYEHPPELAADLRDVSIARIAMLLREELPCATLFEVGEQALAKQPQVCLLTLSPCAVAANDAVATGYLLNLPAAWTALIPTQHHLPAEQLLAFIVDHEVFHCLDSHFYGGQPRGYESHWGEFWQARNEMAADAFAIAMHRRRHGDDSPFVTNLARIRGLALYLGDPQHFTYEAIRIAGGMAQRDLAALTLRELVDTARRIGAEQLPDYPRFLDYWATAYQAMQVLEVQPTDGSSPPMADGAEVDPILLQRMVETSQRLDLELFGR